MPSPTDERTDKQPKASPLERRLLAAIKRALLPDPVREHQFCPERRWRFDLAWPACKVAMEIEGGIWTRGRHTRGAGFQADCEKYNWAALEGWIVLRVTSEHIDNSHAVRWLNDALTMAWRKLPPTCRIREGGPSEWIHPPSTADEYYVTTPTAVSLPVPGDRIEYRQFNGWRPGTVIRTGGSRVYFRLDNDPSSERFSMLRYAETSWRMAGPPAERTDDHDHPKDRR